jgi:endonuclease/exonuclease/phosphatase family metal-dependent hydrolase
MKHVGIQMLPQRTGGAALAIGIALGSLCGVVRGESLRIATYNVENYCPADRMTAEGYRQAYPKPEAEKRALRGVIRGLRADLLFLQEMGGPTYLEELRRDLKAEGIDYPFAVLLEADDADRHVALLSRRPLKAVVPHRDLKFSYFSALEPVKRGLLEVTIATAAGDLTLFGVHLKSRFTDRPDDPQSARRRTEEAVAIRDRVLERISNPATARFLLLGDCNDSPPSQAMHRLRQRGKTEIAGLLPATDTRGETWTHNYRKEDSYSRVDHILVSAALRPAVAGGVAHIYDGPGVREASDHRPVWVTLELVAQE